MSAAAAALRVEARARETMAEIEAVTELVNRSLGRSPAERRRTRELIGVTAAGA